MRKCKSLLISAMRAILKDDIPAIVKCEDAQLKFNFDEKEFWLINDVGEHRRLTFKDFIAYRNEISNHLSKKKQKVYDDISEFMRKYIKVTYRSEEDLGFDKLEKEIKNELGFWISVEAL